MAFALLALTQERRIHVREALLLAGWTLLGLYSVRNLPLFAVVTAPIFGGLIQPWAEKIINWVKPAPGPRESENVLRGYVWIAAAILFCGAILWRGIPIDQRGTGNVFLPNKMPVQAIDWLKENPQDGRMFNHFIWGGYILYRMWPDELVFIGGQTDFYGETLFREYLDVINLSDGWENILNKYDISWMIIPSHDRLAEYMKSTHDSAWHVIYEDDTASIFRRAAEKASP